MPGKSPSNCSFSLLLNIGSILNNNSIFLGSILATKLSKDKNIPICFNRKEAKDHGEGGSLIGATPKGNVLIVDDVVSSGLAITEALTILKDYEVNIPGALVTLDRQEKGQNTNLMASLELKSKGLDIFSIISLDDLLSASEVIDEEVLQNIKNYRDEFGGKDV